MIRKAKQEKFRLVKTPRNQSYREANSNWSNKIAKSEINLLFNDRNIQIVLIYNEMLVSYLRLFDYIRLSTNCPSLYYVKLRTSKILKMKFKNLESYVLQSQFVIFIIKFIN